MEITKFANPDLLWLLTLLAPAVGAYVYHVLYGNPAVEISTVRGFEGHQRSYRYWLRHAPFALWAASFTLLVVALARPQNSESGTKSSTEGIDIVMTLDISTSMLSRDFQPDRLEAAKEMAARFVTDRLNDRIGIVVFAGESFTKAPLTTDKRTLLNNLQSIDGREILRQAVSGVFEDGTAIGNGLATAINRLKESQSESKVVILLTDGVNNRGQIAPLTAAGIAKEFGIRVYTIGVGSVGMAPSPALDMWGGISFVPSKVEIDEDILRQIAEMTGGEYFRATDNSKLDQIYDQINTLEKNKVEIDDYTRYHELFQRYLLWGLTLLLLGLLVKMIFLRGIPY